MSKYFKTIRDSSSIYILEEISDDEALSLSTDMYMEIEDRSLLGIIETSEKVVVIDRNKKDIYFVDKKDVPNNMFMGVNEDNKINILKLARHRLEAISNKIDMIDYIRYIDTNNELNARGFFITDKNKESKFLEILELGDEDLIDTLESFLILRDSLSVLKNAKIEFDRVYEKILTISNDDIEGIREIADSIAK